MTLRFTAFLGPADVLEAAETRMGVLPSTLCLATPFDGWREAEGMLKTVAERLAEAFLSAIKQGEHLKVPVPDEVAELLAHGEIEPEPRSPVGPDARLVLAVMHELVDPGDYAAWRRVEEKREAAERIVALVERKAAA